MRKVIILLAVLISLASCKSEGAMDKCSKDGYQRRPLLENLADNIIIPSYTFYQNELLELNNAVGLFSETSNSVNLIAVREAWLDAYIAWQHVAIFEIGKAENTRLRDYSNSFPLNEIIVDENIRTGQYKLSLSSNLYAQGFPAVDYLINGLGASDTEILNIYNDDTVGPNHKKYLEDVVARLKEMSTAVLDDWNGNYRDVFVSSDCSSETSSLDKITNDFVYNLEEVVRVKKLDKGIQNASKVEGLYKQDISRLLLKESVIASKNFFNGKNFNSDIEGESLKTYLNVLQTMYQGELLSVVINNNYEIAFEKVDLLDENFYENISSNSANYLTAKNAIEDVVIRLKFEMLTAIGSKIDFSSTDGD